MERKRSILIADDESTMRDFLEASLNGQFKVTTATSGEDAWEKLRGGKFDYLLSDIQMPGMGGMGLLDRIMTEHGEKPLIIMMTAFGTIEQAVDATRKGAFDYLTKPFGLDQLNHVIGQAQSFVRLRTENRTLRKTVAARNDHHGLLGNNNEMVKLREKIAMIAGSRGTVLLQGESGTGKEVVARAIHESGPRAEGPFIRLNCAAIPETLLESELFGHERGAFTGAAQARMGKFELADGGTLLLDEISEMAFPMQAKLLRVLQEREFTRLGAKYATSADVRIIATTNRNLKEEIQARRFREDLYFRLNVIPMVITPLRRRKDDIPLLASHFCQIFCAENGKPVMTITEPAMKTMLAMDWPGNVRQLQNVLERAVILTGGDTLDESALGLSDEIDATAGPAAINPEMTLKDMERELILRKLQLTHGNRTQAANELGISVRTLRNKLNLYTRLGMDIPG